MRNIYKITHLNPFVSASALLGITLFGPATFADTDLEAKPNDAEMLQWLDSDAEDQALNVNEGDLAFLAKPPVNKSTHTVTNTITITKESLKTRWVNLYQCHKNLDPVPLTEIVYAYQQMRNLRIEHYYGMDKAWIENQTVQMQGIEKGATLCVTADVQILVPTQQGEFRLRNGPYFRKFLDGYYPFHLVLNINYPSALISLSQTSPKPQLGFNVARDEGKVSMDAWFEGKLVVEARFAQLH